MIDFLGCVVHNLAHKTLIHMTSQNGNNNGGQLSRAVF